eukprot:CAMPEP_0182439414 /NCGR_PEP_ID=MMETSP1167-20130531/86425_1 /TAXON_ID=2988 /ORGANISM="Mallomonas Sp, Strain CCMP3275" /LENGTH=578 /DNA_ID=CAMNT_0024633115 /DNA_START=102 /DNA_END=1835 /DNA_ORIENTATION=-
MGKNRHSKDRMFITATEWKQEYGGKKTSRRHGYQALPFDHCALSLAPFHTPACTPEGVIFDIENLIPYVLKYKKNPVTGDEISTKQIIRLNISKNNNNEWHCPVTFKIFNDNSHVVAIKTTGNVYSYEAVNELNIKAKNYTDLISGEKFSKSDIITLQDPTNTDLIALRDINNFKHLVEVREDAAAERAAVSTVRHNPTTAGIMKQIEEKKRADEAAGISKKPLSTLLQKTEEDCSDVAELLALQPLTEDVTPGSVQSEQRASASLTSTSETVCTSHHMRRARAEEVREARYRKMRQVGKKGYVQLQTSLGNLNVELHCDWAPRTCWNFITLCKRGYYDNTCFHRLVKDFMVQGGDPTGTGTGGESALGPGKLVRDEFDSRLKHDSRGILSMANSGQNTNKSQFFITFKGARHLDLVHSIFGRVVGGGATLDRIEATETEEGEKPVVEIRLLRTEVFVNPVEEAEALLSAAIQESVQRRQQREEAVPSAVKSSKGGLSQETAITALKEIERSEENRERLCASAERKTDKDLGVSATSHRDEAEVASFMKSRSASYATDSAGESVTKKRRTGYSDFSSW